MKETNPFVNCGLSLWQQWEDAHRDDKGVTMKHPDRQVVYDALDDHNDAEFAAFLYALSGVNRVMALAVIDDPTPNAKLDEVIKPFMAKLG